ncbi:MAG: ketopantoate reductase family protein [Deltaproteobacteria bacterium]|nr:ketopantoate reductase family protein [Deltaproteobacteria bacterium]
MKIVIVGAGALGRLFGALLAKGGEELCFVEPDAEVVAAINAKGVGVSGHGQADPEKIDYYPARAVVSGLEVKECGLLIMTVKSYHLYEAIVGVSHLVSDDSPVVCLLNGLGHFEVMERIVARKNIIAGFTNMAATAFGPGLVVNDGVGKTKIGEHDGALSPRLGKISAMLNRCAIETEPVHDIISRLWCKVIVHAAINSVSAVLRERNGHLIEGVEPISLLKRLVDEGEEIAGACGVVLGSTDLYEMLLASCRRTFNHLSPMLQDIINRRKTEVDSLNGILYRYGKRNGVEAITHLTMFELIRSMEKSYGMADDKEERF